MLCATDLGRHGEKFGEEVGGISLPNPGSRERIAAFFQEV
jgi:hypothetical protein